MRRILSLLSIALLTALACDAPTEPAGPGEVRRLSLVRPVIDSGRVWASRLRDGGLVHLTMTSRRASVFLPPEEYFEVEVVSTGGDAERLRVGREYLHDQLGIHRHSISVGLREGEDPARLISRLGTAARVRDSRTSFGAVTLSLHVFEDTEWVIRTARGVRGVEYAERWPTFWTTPPSHDFFAVELVGALPFDLGSAVPSNGTFTAMPGDTIRVRYVQPTGDTLVVTGVVP